MLVGGYAPVCIDSLRMGGRAGDAGYAMVGQEIWRCELGISKNAVVFSECVVDHEAKIMASSLPDSYKHFTSILKCEHVGEPYGRAHRVGTSLDEAQVALCENIEGMFYEVCAEDVGFSFDSYFEATGLMIDHELTELKTKRVQPVSDHITSYDFLLPSHRERLDDYIAKLEAKVNAMLLFVDTVSQVFDLDQKPAKRPRVSLCRDWYRGRLSTLISHGTFWHTGLWRMMCSLERGNVHC